MKRHKLLTLIAVFSFSICYGQSSLVDSLRQLTKSMSGKEKADALNILSFEMLSFDYQKSKVIAKEALELSQKLQYNKGIVHSMINDAICEYSIGNNVIAIPEFKGAIRLCEKSDLSQLKGFALTYMSIAYQSLNDLDSSELSLKMAYPLLKDSTEPYYLSFLYLNLGLLSGLRNEPEQELKYYLRCWNIRTHLKVKNYLVFAGEKIATLYINKEEFDSANYYLSQSKLALGKDTVGNEETSIIYKLQAMIRIARGDFVNGLTLFNKSRSFYERNNSTFDLAKLHLEIGIILADISNYEISLKNYFEGLQLAEKYHYELERARLLFRIAWVYYEIGQNSIANEFCERSYKIAMERHYTSEQGYILNLFGLLAERQKQEEKALHYYNQSLSIREQLKEQKRIASTLLNIGTLYESMNELKKAEEIMLRSLKIENAENHKLGITYCYQSLAQLYIKMGNIAEATNYLDKGEKLAMQIKANTTLLDLYKNRRDIMISQSRPDDAMRYSILYETLKDSIFTINLSNRISLLQYDFKLEQQANEIKIISQQRDLEKIEKERQIGYTIAGLVGFLLATIVIIVGYRSYLRIKSLNHSIAESNEEIQTQSEELRESNDLLTTLNRELQASQEEIVSQNEELTQNQEEIASQRDLLSGQNKVLEEARLIIEKQNEENKNRNANLEIEVEKRTQELLEYNQQLEQFAFISSHNLRAPVARILGLGELLSLTNRNASDEEFITKSLISSAQELDRIVKDLNTILEIKKNATSIVTHIEMSQELTLLLSNLEKEISDTQAKISFDFSEVNELHTVRPYFDSIMINLIQNAIKYRNPTRPPIIKIKSRLDRGTVCITVEDNGLGIDLTLYKDKVFKLYSRFHSHVEGKGLGLYLVKTQVSALGGRIELESRVNHGCKFSIYLNQSGLE